MTEIKDKVELVSIDKIIKYTNNPKSHPSDQIDKIASSIKNYGFDQPIVVDGENEIIKGHGRLEAARKLGLEQVPVITQEDLSKAEVKGARLADNKTAESEWLDEELVLELDELEEMDFDLELAGFGEEELSKILDGQKEAEEDDFVAEMDEDEEAEAEWGQIYKLGKHRLMCGDATEEEDVEALMNGAEADMVFTDPPYGIAYSDKNTFLNDIDKGNRIQKDIENDSKSTEELKNKIITPAFNNFRKYLTKKGSYYITAPSNKGLLKMMTKVLKNAEIPMKHILIWVKNNHILGRSDYNYRHELILFGWKEKHEFYGNGGLKTTVWEVDKPVKSKLHSTMKPVKLISNALRNSSLKEDIILDPFGGSGSTLIAAEQLDRKCYIMEIDPHYVDVIIDRWEEYTGDTAELANK